MAIFPDAAKIAAVLPIDKGTGNKNSISNFRSVSILSIFSEISEVVIKNQLALYVEKKFSALLSAYRENYSMQHVLFRLVKNAFHNDFFYDIANISVHNFADDNTLSCFAKAVKDLINVLKEESEVPMH